ncbi:unnamed protein product [Caenorhabditis auriculariae]|uniref:Acyl-CoA dehydrogenase/oxidase C-terminal domain-containing protein n=1 Tax=Caenorhabditis auriculariae TaxID=2777116 RepID=A0A8S1GZ60_9PELO|nr:unnamed protein product [Caenorhabditis auriculariae]
MLQEAGKSSATEAVLLRLITPVLKLYAGKQCVPLISEGIECFGGQGYMEDTGLPTLLRDAQVTPIWEGTTNVLSLDVLRVFSGKENVLQAFQKRVSELTSNVKNGEDKLSKAKEAVEKALKALQMHLVKGGDSALSNSIRIDAVARHISFAISRIYCGALLIDHASDKSTAQTADVDVAYRWCCEQPLIDLQSEWFSTERVESDRGIVFDSYAAEPQQRGSKL